jgi:nitroreductase
VLDQAAAETAVALAVLAPSIHNTQPWRWSLEPRGLVVRADRDRQLTVADPDGHSLLISCGAALRLTELALLDQGFEVRTTRFPDPADPDALALIEAVGAVEPGSRAAEVAAARRRRSDRRPFAPRQLDEAVVEQLRDAAAVDSVRVDFPVQEDQRINLAVAVSWADGVQRDDAEYRAEMAKWLRDPQVNAPSDDGIPLANVPLLPPGAQRRTDVPVRDFQEGVSGQQLIERDIDEKPLIAVVLADSDQHLDQLRAGESMMGLMIRAELLGLSTCPLSQAVDLAAFRVRLQSVMGWVGHPQMMLRVGYPGGPVEELLVPPRRPVAEVLDH